jgi:hypothetical protein
VCILESLLQTALQVAFALHVVLHEERDFESFLVTAQANKYTASQRG